MAHPFAKKRKECNFYTSMAYKACMETNTMSPELLQKYNKRKNLMLALSVILDIVGILTYFVPFLGEGFDLAWAPIAGFAMYIMYGGFIGVFGGMFVFLEELMPFTDVIPGFLIMWVIKYVILAKKTQQQFMDAKGEHVLPAHPNANKQEQLPANG